MKQAIECKITIQRSTRKIVKTKLPCGGRVVVTFNEHRPASVDGNVEILPLPVIYCPKSYDEAKGCPWIERLRKFYSGLVDLDVRKSNGCAIPFSDEAKVENTNGVVTCVLQAQDRGIVVRGVDQFEDSQLPIKSFEESDDQFYCCNDVKARHGGIIAFFKRLIGGKWYARTGR